MERDGETWAVVVSGEGMRLGMVGSAGKMRRQRRGEWVREYLLSGIWNLMGSGGESLPESESESESEFVGGNMVRRRVRGMDMKLSSSWEELLGTAET